MMVLIAAAAIWLVLAFTRKRTLMLAASAILAGAWLWSAATPVAAVTQARAATGVAALQTCATLAEGMSVAEVQSRVGDPDEVRSDEETRGPGASILIYRASRCAVHVLDGRVELIE